MEVSPSGGARRPRGEVGVSRVNRALGPSGRAAAVGDPGHLDVMKPLPAETTHEWAA
jgi:hypothetical protein